MGGSKEPIWVDPSNPRTRTSAPSTLTTSEAQAPWGHRHLLRHNHTSEKDHMLIQMFDKFKPQFLAKTKIHQNYTCCAACTVFIQNLLDKLAELWCVFDIIWLLVKVPVGAISTDLLLRCHLNHPSQNQCHQSHSDCRDVPDMLDESMEGFAKTCGFLFVKSYNVIHIHEAKNVFCASHMHRNACIWSIIVTYIISGERHRWN